MMCSHRELIKIRILWIENGHLILNKCIIIIQNYNCFLFKEWRDEWMKNSHYLIQMGELKGSTIQQQKDKENI